jgi:hypothetical protein
MYHETLVQLDQLNLSASGMGRKDIIATKKIKDVVDNKAGIIQKNQEFYH